MIYALVRGWLAGMGVLLIEILLGAFFFTGNFSPPLLLGDFDSPFLSLVLVAFLEESAKFAALRGISSETIPFFRNAIFKGLLVGFGFALFEMCIKILFHTDATTDDSLFLGALSSTLLHIATGGILGAAWFSRIKNQMPVTFFALFLLAFAVHTLYNAILAPLLFAPFSS